MKLEDKINKLPKTIYISKDETTAFLVMTPDIDGNWQIGYQNLSQPEYYLRDWGAIMPTLEKAVDTMLFIYETQFAPKSNVDTEAKDGTTE